MEHSVIFYGGYVGKDAIVRDSIVLPGARVEEGAVVEYSIIGQDSIISRNATVGQRKEECPKGAIAAVSYTHLDVYKRKLEIP